VLRRFRWWLEVRNELYCTVLGLWGVQVFRQPILGMTSGIRTGKMDFGI